MCAGLAAAGTGINTTSPRMDSMTREPTGAPVRKDTEGPSEHASARAAAGSRAGTALVCVTHDQAFVDALADRVLTMNDGALSAADVEPSVRP